MSGARDVFGLDAGTWSTLRELLAEGLSRPAEERAAWLDGLDPGHAALLPRLRALLARAATDAPARLDAPPEALPAPPERVGPYRLLRELGSGGMATVWLAERTDLLHGRQVALKLPHGAWRRAGLAARMAREREILATLEHPHIARLYDAGLAEDGQPWLALEYVEGEPIDAYCDGLALPVSARLRLFLQVLRAVAHAHAQLVVHRDLKPANVLVTAAGEVRLLDFGIAKLLLEDGEAAETELTRAGGRVLTLAYAAPEQVLGKPVGAAADVHALGVMLFELLAGTRPFRLRRDSAAELEEAILSAEPLRPSAVAPPGRRRALRGDLDTVVLKALRKDPRDRYPTAEAFAADVEAHLEARPVRARALTTGYRLRKFATRNRVALTAGGLAAAALLGVAGVAVQQAQEAEAARLRAEREAEQALQAARVASGGAVLADFFAGDLASGRSVDEFNRQVERAATMVREEYAGDALVRARLLAVVASRARQFGEYARHRALAAEAAAAAREARDTSTAAQVECWRGRDLAQQGDHAGARGVLDAALAALRAEVPPQRSLLAQCLMEASAVARVSGDAARALASIEEARDLEVAAGLARTGSHASTLVSLSRAYGLAGRFGEAVATAGSAVSLWEELGGAGGAGALGARMMLATYLRDGGQPARALALMDAMLEEDRRKGGDPGAFANLVHERAVTLTALGRPADAIPALAAVRARAARAENSPLVRASSVAELDALVAAGRLADARAAAERTGTLYPKLRADRAWVARLFLFPAVRLALAEGDLAGAGRLLDELHDVLARAPPGDPARRIEHRLRARLAAEAGDHAAARRHADTAVGLAEAQSIDAAASFILGDDLLLRAEVRAGAGDHEGARLDAAAAARHLEATAGAAHPAVARARALAG